MDADRGGGCSLEALGNWEEGQPSSLPSTLQKEKFPDFFFSFLERHFGPGDAMAWAYTIFEYIKLFHTNEVMSQFYAVLMGKVSLGLALYPLSPA